MDTNGAILLVIADLRKVIAQVSEDNAELRGENSSLRAQLNAATACAPESDTGTSV